MPGPGGLRKIGGHAISVLGLLVGLGAGAAVGITIPALPGVGVLVAMTMATVVGGAGFLVAGEVFTASCPCCSARTMATTWRQTFQCRRCQTMCALAALGRRRNLRVVRPAGR